MSGELSEHDQRIIADVLAPFAGKIQRVALFGSRGLGAARPNSDVDLVLYGDIQEHEVDRLWTLFDESSLSVSVDVIVYADDLYPPLKRHIDAFARTLFDGDALRRAA
jgi:predicted nucleotidyltransferase